MVNTLEGVYSSSVEMQSKDRLVRIYRVISLKSGIRRSLLSPTRWKKGPEKGSYGFLGRASCIRTCGTQTHTKHGMGELGSRAGKRGMRW